MDTLSIYLWQSALTHRWEATLPGKMSPILCQGKPLRERTEEELIAKLEAMTNRKVCVVKRFPQKAQGD